MLVRQTSPSQHPSQKPWVGMAGARLGWEWGPGFPLPSRKACEGALRVTTGVSSNSAPKGEGDAQLHPSPPTHLGAPGGVAPAGQTQSQYQT